MPFYLRKSISAGPFRFNLSKSGVGLSVGVKGLRLGTGPRGHYIHAGRGGLYYRASLGPAGQKAQVQPTQPLRNDGGSSPAQQTYFESGVEMIEVESGDVLSMRDERFDELLNELNSKQAELSYATMLCLGVGAIGLATTYLLGGAGAVAFVLALPAWAAGNWLDSYKRKSVLFYSLEPDAARAYEAMTKAFDEMMACAGQWHIEAGGAVRDLSTWKRNAGATHIVKKNPTKLDYTVPTAIASNITPPSVQVGKQTIYFFPDVALMFAGKQVGAIAYENLTIRWQDSAFIEEGTIPADAKVISHTWKHPNKKGGPDRRFANNYEIPVCLYEVAHLTTNSGLNELLEFSRTGVVAPFASAMQALLALTGRAQAPALAGGTEEHSRSLPRRAT